MHTLETLKFDNTYARLPETFRRLVKPTALPAPYLVSFNSQAAELIDLDPRETACSDFAEYFAGNKLFAGSEPVAAIYAGHQFGSFVPQLGDGRAILLGETVNKRGEHWDIQLKGAGETEFSRRGDGRAVLRSTIREYLCSEAMHALGIPTTRALCIVGSDEPVYRETVETAAVLTRLARSHVRFGTFELFYSRGQFAEVQQLADYVIENHYAHLLETENKYLEFLREVVTRTARLIAAWQAVGFAHGVMNTDNMSVLGLTIDYGPFGFLDEYEAGFVCNHSDYTGRYAFDQQPAVALWNLSKFAQTLVPLVEVEAAVAALNEYQDVFVNRYAEFSGQKLGLQTQQPEDSELWSDLLEILENNRVDYTVFLRRLCDFKINGDNQILSQMFINPTNFEDWAQRYAARLEFENSIEPARRAQMNAVNPKYVLRNHLAQAVIEKAESGDFGEVDVFLKVLQNPFDEQPEFMRFAEPPPPNSRRVVVSCSS